MLTESYLAALYNAVRYWQTLILGISIHGSIGLLVVLFVSDLKRYITSRQRYILLLFALVCMIITPITFHFIQKKKIDIFTFQVVLHNSISHIEHHQCQNILIADNDKKTKIGDFFTSDNGAVAHVFWVVVWLTGVLFAGLRILIGLYGIRKIVKKSIRIDHNCIKETKRILNINEDVKVLVSNHVATPGTAGFISPVIIVPKQCFSWSAERWKTVLLHEMYHIKRHDNFFNMLIQIACALHWYNPLVWFAESKFREERETSCDQFVLKSGIQPYRYAMHLLEIIKEASNLKYVKHVVVGVDGMSKTENRIRGILSFTIPKKSKPKHEAFVCIFLAALTLSLSIVKINFLFQDNNQIAEIKYINGTASFTDTMNGINITNASLNDIPSWPSGAGYWTGPIYTHHHNGKYKGITYRNADFSYPRIYAAADGIVKEVSLIDTLTRQFATITIQHKHNLSTTYAFLTIDHMVTPGNIVKKGELIGMGANCWVVFSVEFKTTPIDPMPFLSKDKIVS